MIVAASLMPAERPELVGIMPYTEVEFTEQLTLIGETRYHSLHPFHQLLHNGLLHLSLIHICAADDTLSV